MCAFHAFLLSKYQKDKPRKNGLILGGPWLEALKNRGLERFLQRGK
jgi:hypothetical protein